MFVFTIFMNILVLTKVSLNSCGNVNKVNIFVRHTLAKW
jgi:hypothetical protein